jgi:endonuclease/exonuclease/phosphatase (EEP) superfamily protein YafD
MIDGTTAMPTQMSPRSRRAAMVQLPSRRRTRDAVWWVRTLAWLNLAAVVAVVVLICGVSERWWLSALLTYLPRQPYAVPALLLLPATLIVCPKLAWTQLVALVLVLGPLMGPTVPSDAVSAPVAGRRKLRIVSGNLQEGRGSVRKLMAEIEPFQPDVVVFQEAADGCEALLQMFDGWQVVHLDSYFIGSRYPLRVVDHCRAKAFDRWTAVAVEVDTPDGQAIVTNVHMMTPRHGASGINVTSPLTGAGVADFEWHQELRADEAAETRAFLQRLPDRPLLVLGDFNAPSTSSLYRAHWGDLRNVFDVAGAGYGYTSPCNAGRKWLPNTPWMRIDHVLADDHWAFHSCRIGTTDGSDHRLVFTEVSLRE